MEIINKNRIAILFFTLILFVFLIYKEFQINDFLKVSFLDVGQGDSIYINAFGKSDMLIDGGRNGSILLRQLASVMNFGDNKIDILLITHPDEDHSGGLLSLLEEYEIGILIISGNFADNVKYNQILEIANKRNIPTFLARSGMNIYLDRQKKVCFEILYPFGDVSFVEANISSIVGRLVFNQSEFILTGDAYIQTEKDILKSGQNVRADILKLGHHGSKTSSDILFLEKVSPEIVIISAGKNNSYGHPHREVMEKIEKLNLQYLATYQIGNITFESDGNKIYLKNKK